MNWQILEKKIRKKFNEIISLDDTIQVDDNTELLQNGILSSLSMIELLVMIEKETATRIVNNQSSISDFSTLKKILSITKDAIEGIPKDVNEL